VLNTADLYDLAEKRAQLREYASDAKSWAEVNKAWVK